MARKEKRKEDAFVPKYFSVEIEGIEKARFTKCEGLEAETYIYEVEEGGLNSNTHKFVGRTRFPNLVLENGVTANNDLFQWHKDTTLSDKKIERKDGSVVMCNANGEEIKRWNFFRALPCRWVGPKLGKDVPGMAVERIEIAHEGIELAK